MGRKIKPCSHGLPTAQCKPCKNAYKRSQYTPKTRKINKIPVHLFVREYKIALKHCVICMIKINENNFMMFALDHRDPAQKLFNLSQANCQPRHLVLAECQKCELMCHNCHHLKTHQNNDHKIRRGEITAQDDYLPLLELMYATD